MTRPTNGSDVVLDAEAWTVVLRDGVRVSITVNHHATRDTGQRWCYATAQWPGIESRLHLSGNTAERAAMRLVAAAINNGTDEDAVGVREILSPGEMSAPPDDITDAELDDINGLANNQRDTIEALERDAAETAEVLARQTRILTGVADALEGPPAPLSAHSHHDLAERAAEVVTLLARETAARKSYEEGITWETTCLGCASWVSRCYAETMRAETAEAERDAAMAARERDARHLREWMEAHAPTPGTSPSADT